MEGCSTPVRTNWTMKARGCRFLIVIALVVLASFAGVVWLAYSQGVQRGRQDAPRIVAAPQSERVASQPKHGELRIQTSRSISRRAQTKMPRKTVRLSPRRR